MSTLEKPKENGTADVKIEIASPKEAAKEPIKKEEPVKAEESKKKNEGEEEVKKVFDKFKKPPGFGISKNFK